MPHFYRPGQSSTKKKPSPGGAVRVQLPSRFATKRLVP
jgi:hypothetical protein